MKNEWVGVVALLNLPVHESQFFEDVSFDDYRRIGESPWKESHAGMHIFFLFFLFPPFF